MAGGEQPMANEAAADASGPLGWWTRIPLYWRILAGMLLGVALGVLLGERAEVFRPLSHIILQLLGALAPPLILIAVVHVIMTSDIPRSSVAKLAGLLLLNTTVAILIGLSVANLLQPGTWGEDSSSRPTLSGPLEVVDTEGEDTEGEDTEGEDTEGEDTEGEDTEGEDTEGEDTEGENTEGENTEGENTEGENTEGENTEGENTEGEKAGLFDQLLESVPRSLLGPLGDKQNVIGVIIIAVAFGIAMRSVKTAPLHTLQDFVELAYQTILVVLHWVIELVPIGVLCVVAAVVGTEGFGAFAKLAAFVVAVLLALALQTTWYVLRVQFFSWVSPWKMLWGMRDALVMAFSTDSSTATMPVTYRCLTEEVKVSKNSASLGALVGANFNNDGTALYEAMAALFVAQLLGQHLDLTQQLIVVATSILASVGAAGIPEAGIVTMTLVFTAVGLDVKYIPLLLTVDWFLDRCRTTINVLGDVNVSCILDGRIKPQPAGDEASQFASNSSDPGLVEGGSGQQVGDAENDDHSDG